MVLLCQLLEPGTIKQIHKLNRSPTVSIFLKKASLAGPADLYETHARKVRAGAEIWISGAGLRGHNASARQRRGSQKL